MKRLKIIIIIIIFYSKKTKCKEISIFEYSRLKLEELLLIGLVLLNKVRFDSTVSLIENARDTVFHISNFLSFEWGNKWFYL